MNTDERIAKLKELWSDGWRLEDALEEIEDSLSEDEFKPKETATVEGDETRWMIHTLDIVEIDEGVYVGVRWERGKTENQEDEFNDDNVYAVEPVEVTRIEWNTGEKL